MTDLDLPDAWYVDDAIIALGSSPLLEARLSSLLSEHSDF